MIKSTSSATDHISNDDLTAMTQAASSLRSHQSAPLFHTPPPIDRSKSWLVEKSERESYGIIDETVVASSGKESIKSSTSSTTSLERVAEGEEGDDGVSSSTSSSTSTDNKHDEIAHDDSTDPNSTPTTTPTPTVKPTPPPLPRRNTHDSELPHSTPLLPRKLSPAVDSFIHSLQEPKYMTPLSGDEIAALYQDFYHQFHVQAEEYIISSSSSALNSKSRSPKEVPMQTYKEIAEKKRERSLRPSRIKSLTESAEVLACETVYNKIFSISFGDDRPRNDHLQNRVHCLKSIPISLHHLALPINESELLPLLHEAGEELLNMDRAKNPKAKLQYLLKTHKILVAALTEKRSDQTSADSILPVLIFTFIYYQTPNLWLNMNFIKRFRNKEFLQGEDMYCLTNFEAAIEFLETLTLDALSIDISSIPTSIDITPLLTKSDSDPLKLSSPRSSRSNSLQQPPSISPRRQSSSPNVGINGGLLGKRLSILYPTDLASNAVNSADQGIKSFSSTFGSSYKFLVGRFLDKKDGQGGEEKYPDTLAEARKVVGLDGPPPSGSEGMLSDENLASFSPSRDAGTPVNGPATTNNTTNNTVPPPPPPPFPTLPQSRSRSSSLHLANNNLGSTESIIGKFAGGVMRNFRSPSFSQHSDDNPPESITPNGSTNNKISKPLEKFLTNDTDSLKLSDIKELHADYKRLVNHLKSLNAFE